MTLEDISDGRALIKRRNRIGPRTKPLRNAIENVIATIYVINVIATSHFLYFRLFAFFYRHIIDALVFHRDNETEVKI